MPFNDYGIPSESSLNSLKDCVDILDTPEGLCFGGFQAFLRDMPPVSYEDYPGSTNIFKLYHSAVLENERSIL